MAQILPFPSTRPDSTIFRNPSEQFFISGTDSTFSRYSSGFYNFSVLTLILPFSDTRPDTFSVQARILPISGTHTDSNLFQNSSGQFFNYGMDSTFSWDSPGFWQFLVLTLILPFSETRPDSLSIVARILPFLGTRPYSTILKFSH